SAALVSRLRFRDRRVSLTAPIIIEHNRRDCLSGRPAFSKDNYHAEFRTRCRPDRSPEDIGPWGDRRHRPRDRQPGGGAKLRRNRADAVRRKGGRSWGRETYRG